MCDFNDLWLLVLCMRFGLCVAVFACLFGPPDFRQSFNRANCVVYIVVCFVVCVGLFCCFVLLCCVCVLFVRAAFCRLCVFVLLCSVSFRLVLFFVFFFSVR